MRNFGCYFDLILETRRAHDFPKLYLRVVVNFKLSVYPKLDHFHIHLITIFHVKKIYEKKLILRKVINEKCFYVLIHFLCSFSTF